MTYKVLSGTYVAAGYVLSSKYTGLNIEYSATIGGTGVSANFLAVIENYGAVRASGSNTGVSLTKGGTVKNGDGAEINGNIGVSIKGGAGTVQNSGDIENNGGVTPAVGLYAGGVVDNNSNIYSTIHGGVYVQGEAGTVLNSGAITGNNDAVKLVGGGVVVNGALSTSFGTILAKNIGVYAEAAATVTNFGLVEALGQGGVVLKAGGVVINGAPTQTQALIDGADHGVYVEGAAGSVSNYGTISAGGATSNFNGVGLSDGGKLTNGATSDTQASIQGYSGVSISGAAGTVVNFGAISGEGASNSYGVTLTDGGALTNGNASDTKATVQGYSGVAISAAAGTVTNFGTINGSGDPTGSGIVSQDYVEAFGVYLADGGHLTNGASTDRVALISGGYEGVLAKTSATVVNFGTIQNTADFAEPDSEGEPETALDLNAGGSLTNGSLGDQHALIVGYQDGVQSPHGAATVLNFGTIEAVAYGKSAAVVLSDGGAITNGALGDTRALITGYAGAFFQVAGVVTNFGTIEGTGAHYGGVAFGGGGELTNGAATDTRATVSGVTGVTVSGAAGTVSNFGTLHGFGTGATNAGLYLADGGVLTNGAVNDVVAVVDGYNGLIAAGAAATLANFGTLAGVGLAEAGVYLKAGGFVTNGTAGDTRARVGGFIGVETSGAATVTNYGTIIGYGGTAVLFNSSADDLIVEANAKFAGEVNGGGGTLELASGYGALTGLLAGGDVTVQEEYNTTCVNFGTVKIDAPANFTLAGSGGTITTGQALILAGTLGGTGTLSLTGGTSTFNTGADLAIANVAQSGAAVADFAGASLTVGDVWTQSAGTVSVGAGDRVNFTGTGNTFSGTLTGTGTIAFTAGTDTLSAAAIEATSTLIEGATVTLAGAIDLTKTLSVISPDVIVAAAGATLSGKGIISLSDATTNVIKGASASSALTNFDDKIEGAGQLGDGAMAFTNDAKGTIDAYLSDALTINLGTNTFTNAGLIESDGAGGLAIDGATDNTGTLEAIKGTLAVEGAVTGAGTVKIAGGTADFASTFTQNVAFTTAGGVLELADATTYTGTITGFATTTITSLDLTDITLTSGTTKATYSGTATSGVLTVTDGTHTAKIALTGNYTSSTFTVASDGHGGTTVTDPTAQATKAPVTTLPLITAMAGFGGASGASYALATEAAHIPLIALAAPGAAVA